MLKMRLTCLTHLRLPGCHLSLILLSILYKTKLPFILVFNKTDVQKHDFAVKWMTDFEAFQKVVVDPSDSIPSKWAYRAAPHMIRPFRRTVQGTRIQAETEIPTTWIVSCIL